MEEAEESRTPSAIEIAQIFRAIRFALVAIVVGLSYFSLRGSLNISGFSRIFTEMLPPGHPLPVVTIWVINAQVIFILISGLLPAIAIITLFIRSFVISFHLIGALTLVSIIQLIILFNALFAPCTQMITVLSGSSTP